MPAPVAPAEGHADSSALQPAALQRLGTKASVTPMVIVSSPSRSQRSLARASEPACAFPSMDPKAKMVSYSGIFAVEARQLPVADLVLLAAGHRALEAGGVPVVIVRVHLLTGDRERVGEGFLAEVVGAERSQRIDRLDEERRAVGRRAPWCPSSAARAAARCRALRRRRVGQLRSCAPATDTALTRLAPSTAPMPPRPATPSRFFQ